MKKLMTDWEWLSIRILILGITVFSWSYITEMDGIDRLFGDTWEKQYDDSLELKWGFRHFVYTVTFSLITLVQVFRVFKWIDVRSRYGGFKVRANDN